MTWEQLIDQTAIQMALGNNGGEWATHYTDDQKNFWRDRAREIIRGVAEIALTGEMKDKVRSDNER